MNNTKKPVSLKVNQQQIELLEKLQVEGTFGDSIEEVILNVFREYAHNAREEKE